MDASLKALLRKVPRAQDVEEVPPGYVAFRRRDIADHADPAVVEQSLSRLGARAVPAPEPILSHTAQWRREPSRHAKAWVVPLDWISE